MEAIEISAKTVDEAIQLALEQLSVRREDVEVTVLQEGKHGILGMGSEEAKVKVELLALPDGDDIAEIARNVIETLVDKMGVVASIAPQTETFAMGGEEDSPLIAFDITGNDLGILIGRRGQTLACLQFIARLIVAHRTKMRLPMVVDVEGYRQRRYEALQALAWRIADQVKSRGAPFILEPMAANERRIIHLSLVDDPDVTTQSTGEGDERKVIIMLKEQAD
ncbi:RNA-binding cell elongation regulator Jag/EloR [Chloroflexota bacterium]